MTQAEITATAQGNTLTLPVYIKWHRVNLKSRTQPNLPKPGTECLVVWDDGDGRHCMTGRFEAVGNGAFVGQRHIKAKTGLLWCRASDIWFGVSDLMYPGHR